jgi:hypothetical protein
MSISATRSVDKGRQSLCQSVARKRVPQATWFRMGPKVDFDLISHASLSCILRKTYLTVHSSGFILFYSSPPKVGIRLPVSGDQSSCTAQRRIDHNSSATCSPEIEQDRALFVVDLAQGSASSVADSYARKDVPNAVRGEYACHAVPLLAVLNSASF